MFARWSLVIFLYGSDSIAEGSARILAVNVRAWHLVLTTAVVLSFAVFLLILIGFIFAHCKKISLASVTEIIVYLATPCLVFTSLSGKPLFAGDIAVLLGGITITFAAIGLMIWIYFLVFRFRSRGFVCICPHDPFGVLVDTLRRRTFQINRTGVDRRRRDEIRLDRVFFSM
jgi:hypothetical protein